MRELNSYFRDELVPKSMKSMVFKNIDIEKEILNVEKCL